VPGSESQRRLFEAVKTDMEQGQAILEAAMAWYGTHETASPIEGFMAGYHLAKQQYDARTLRLPPITADVEQLAPAGKSRRTIVAALKLFRDQVLAQTPDEIESGEWCSLTEIDALIQQLEVE
jgi:hypothetical protein